MLNLIIDGDYFIHKTLYVYTKKGSGPKLSTKIDQDSFIKKFFTDLSFSLRKFKSFKHIIIVWDSYSWRKDIEIKENNGYKANREKDNSKIDYDAINTIKERITEIVEKKNFIVSKISRSEGDDLIYLWAKYLNNIDENVIIISADKDISQCVNLSGSKSFTVMYDTNSQNPKVYAPVGFKTYLNDKNGMNLFDMSFMAENDDEISEIIENSTYIEVKPQNVIFEKMIGGDSGDNIPSVWSWQKKSGSKIKNFGITPVKIKMIKENIVNHIGEFILEDVEDYLPIIVDGINLYFKQNCDSELVLERMKRNKILVELKDENIPKSIIEKFNQEVENKLEKRVKYENFNMKYFLEDSDIETSLTIESDFFKNSVF